MIPNLRHLERQSCGDVKMIPVTFHEASSGGSDGNLPANAEP